MTIEIKNKTMFEETIKSGVTLVDFYAEWCGPCKMIAPVIENISKEFVGKANVCKVNVDEQNQIAAQFGVRSIPTLLVFKDGEIVKTMVGYQTQAALVQTINDNLSK